MGDWLSVATAGRPSAQAGTAVCQERGAPRAAGPSPRPLGGGTQDTDFSKGFARGSFTICLGNVRAEKLRLFILLPKGGV